MQLILRIPKRFCSIIFDFIYSLVSVKPHNPMVNSGSIIINALIQTLVQPEISLAEKFDYLNDYIKVMYKEKCDMTANTNKTTSCSIF